MEHNLAYFISFFQLVTEIVVRLFPCLPGSHPVALLLTTKTSGNRVVTSRSGRNPTPARLLSRSGFG
jgi:hypothetical protein